MSFCSIEPSPPLSHFVDSIWYFEGTGLAHGWERILPHGRLQLLVNLDEDELRWSTGERLEAQRSIRGAGVGGLYGRAFAIDTRQQRAIAGVVFAPGGAAPLVGGSAAALADEHVELGDLWQRSGEVLRERLLSAAGSPRRIVATLESALTERLTAGAEPDWAVRWAAGALAEGSAVAAVSDAVGMSARRFRDRFAIAVGASPKQYARIARLARALGERESGRASSWTQIAHACGYHDQAHLIHEFRELTGMRPSQYSARSPGERNHVPLPE